MNEDPANRNRSTASRRDFLFGKGAIEAVQETVANLVKPEIGSDLIAPLSYNQFEPATRRSAYWEQYSTRAMACEFEILFHLQQHPQSAEVATQVFQLIADLEDQMTVYRSHSEVSRINQLAGQQAIPVEPNLFALLETAIELFQETEGAFDITTAALTQLWKFDRRAGALPNQSEIARTLQNVGSNQIELDSLSRTIRFKNSNLQINLGGIGKGYAIDRAAMYLSQKEISDFAVHGGQSSVKTFGSDTPTDGPEQGWWIGLSHPVFPTLRLGQVRLTDQALGTSGTGRQGFFHRGIRYGHVIDPRTGWPASHFLSTTVIADSAARSDALATAFYVMPLEKVIDFCQRHPDVKAILVSAPQLTNGRTIAPDIQAELLVQTFNIADRDLQFIN
jgi:thiamine biosynthesis lipoprotein